jgi:cob(I)alamin adenosyltransferase
VGAIEFEKVTTRGGDHGSTHLVGGEARRKDDPLFEALGDLDELASWLGVLRSQALGRRYAAELREIQERLLVVGAQIATPRLDPLYKKLRPLGDRDLRKLEAQEQRLLERTEIPSRFVLPGDEPQAARIDVARAVCRRAERRLVTLIRDRGMIQLALCQNYLNRLSDYLFVLARAVTQGRAE